MALLQGHHLVCYPVHLINGRTTDLISNAIGHIRKTQNLTLTAHGAQPTSEESANHVKV